VTLVELLLALAIMGIITPVLVSLLTYVTSGFTGYEATSQLRKMNQKTLNRIYLRVGSCKRIFQNVTLDNAFVGRLILTGCPSALAGSALPSIQTASTLNVGTTDFISSSVGNSLFFANNESTQVLATGTVRIDTYRFNYYYVTSTNPNPLPGVESYGIVEWRSVLYADINQLNSITNAALRTNVVKELYGKGVSYTWNPSTTDVNSAFSNLASNGSITLSATHTIPQYKNRFLTNAITGIVFGGYRYGVSCNSSFWTKAPKTVPIYAVAAGKFPGGFEVAIGGPTAGRQILIRSVLVARGSMRSIIGDDTQIVCSARDLW
jgi:type II secretory pathway pseudopilin PulG